MSWIPNIFRRHTLYGDLSEEIRLHIEERTEQLMREGFSREEAEGQARRAFGNRTLLEERSREAWHWPTLESVYADVRFALRELRRSPGFALTAVCTLALGIGANAVVFSLLNALILWPVCTMLVLGLLAAWIPAQRALAADPLILLRED